MQGKLKIWNRKVFGEIRLQKKELLAKIRGIDEFDLEGLVDDSLKAERDSFELHFAEVFRKGENL